MKIGIVGLGYVGLVTAAVLADRGYEVCGIDIDSAKISTLNSGSIPLFEPGVQELLKKNASNLSFSTYYSDLKDADAIFVCVATPDRNGEINLDYVFSAFSSIITNSQCRTIAIKSTVIPGTASKVFEKTGIHPVSNPEFLSEGTAVNDTLHPERVIIGGIDERDISVFADIWAFTGAPVVKTTNESAELIKYASNAFLATKISFINEIANLCEKIPGCDVNVVAKGMGYDKRISPYFLKAGLGFGGSCFPKDTQAIASYAARNGERLRIIESAIEVNSIRVLKNIERIERKYGKLAGKKVCVLGLAFKDNTDDLRYSKSWELASKLSEIGAKVKVYDPVIKASTDIDVVETPQECIKNSDFTIVSNESKEFLNLDYSATNILIDLRGIMENNQADLKVGVFDKN